MRKESRVILIGLILMALLIGGFFAVRALSKPAGVAGSKTITVDVVVPDAQPAVFTIHTDAEFLRGALDEQNLIVGTESDYGFFVQEVNGIKADEAAQQWWCITKDGADVMTGVSETPVEDGDHYELTLKTGW